MPILFEDPFDGTENPLSTEWDIVRGLAGGGLKESSGTAKGVYADGSAEIDCGIGKTLITFKLSPAIK